MSYDESSVDQISKEFERYQDRMGQIMPALIRLDSDADIRELASDAMNILDAIDAQICKKMKIINSQNIPKMVN